MEIKKNELIKVDGVELFDRVVTILDQARANVVRAVNSNMVLAYWMIGREIVEEIQAGDARAEYGKQIVEQLSKQLQKKYSKGFSTTNLWYFRQFYLAYLGRVQILHPSGGESGWSVKLHLQGGESKQVEPKRYPLGSELTTGFQPQLSWSHYRALMRVS